MLALLACGDTALISASATLGAPLSTDMLTVTVQDRTRLIEWRGADFRTERYGTPTTPEIETGSDGPDLTVSYRLEADGRVVSTGTATIPRRNDWRWQVNVITTTTDPRTGCFGCEGSRAFVLDSAFRPALSDSVWLVWGGNYISHPVVY
jgi:hypothetical protein